MPLYFFPHKFMSDIICRRFTDSAKACINLQYAKMTVTTVITIEIMFKTKCVSYTRLTTQGTTYPQRCVRQVAVSAK